MKDNPLTYRVQYFCSLPNTVLFTSPSDYNDFCIVGISPVSLLKLQIFKGKNIFSTSIQVHNNGLLSTNNIVMQKKRNELLDRESLMHAVCAVQVFSNSNTGPLLFQFVSYYLSLSWLVIVHDSFGYHKSFISEFLDHPNFRYFDYAIFDLLLPNKYNFKILQVWKIFQVFYYLV